MKFTKADIDNRAERRNHFTPRPGDPGKASLSIVLTTFRRTVVKHGERTMRLFPRCIASIANAVKRVDFPVEVIVTDWEDFGDVDSILDRSGLKDWEAFKIRGKFSRGVGLNQAAARSSNDVLLFLDSDILVTAPFLRRVMACTAGRDVYFPVCQRAIGPSERFWEWCDKGYGLMAMRRETYASIGPILERHKWGGEDDHYYSRALEQGRAVSEYRKDLLHMWHPTSREWRIRPYLASLVAQDAERERERGAQGASVLILGETLGLGGAEKLTIHIANALASGGHRVVVGTTVTTHGAFRCELREEVGVVQAKNPQAIGRLIDSLEPTVIIGNNCHALRAAMERRNFQHRPRNLTILLHGFGEWSLRLIPKALQDWQSILTMSEQAREGILRGRPDISPESVYIAQTGIDADLFTPGKPPPGLLPWKGKFGPVFGSAGRYSKEKALGSLVKILGIIRRTHPGAKLVHFGGSDAGVKAHKRHWDFWGDDLKEVIEAEGLGEHIHLAGLVDSPVEWLRTMDVFCLTSDFEDLPLVILEAMAAGIPLVSTEVGALPVVLKDGGGVMVHKARESMSEQELEDFAAAAIKMAKRKDRKAVGKKGREAVLARYSLEALKARLLEYVEEVSR